LTIRNIASILRKMRALKILFYIPWHRLYLAEM
jgi:hypothetical protein